MPIWSHGTIIEKRVGTIRQISNSHFVWDIMRVSDFLASNVDSIPSPGFRFEQEVWVLYLTKSKKTPLEKTRFVGLHQSSQNYGVWCSRNYSLCIKDIDGQNYWTSEKKNFCDDSDQGLAVSDIWRNLERITPGATLSIHLTFHPIREHLPGDPTAAILRTAQFGKQTCPSMDKKQSIPSDLDGVAELVQNLKDLLLSGQASDATLIVGGREFKAHRNILVARSPVFSKMFQQDMLEQASGTVQITDCTAGTFQDFLLYLYSGKMETLTVENVIGLYCIADKYDVQPLCAVCVNFMSRNLTVDSFCDYVSLALRHCELELLASANKFFPKNLKKIIDTEKWLDFTAEHSVEARELLVKALSKVQPE